MILFSRKSVISAIVAVLVLPPSIAAEDDWDGDKNCRGD
jgi:hypothetical protein